MRAIPLLSVLAACGIASAAERPNIVFFLADDLGVMDVACNNRETFYETPNISRLAASGVNFTAGYAACNVCSPTRASIMTGKYPARTGIDNFIGGKNTGRLLPPPNANHLALEETTLAEALAEGGYTNFFAGKWHLGNAGFSPREQGFSRDLIGTSQFFYPPGPETDPATDPKTTDRIADAAVRFIAANKGKPFFAFLPFQAVHIPIGARPDLIAKYRTKAGRDNPVEWGRERANKVRQTQNHPAYAAMIEQMDLAIGRVLDALETNGLTGKTIVVFTSDNGGLATEEGHPTSNMPYRAGKGWNYEGGIRVPWIIRAPGVAKAGGSCATPVVSADFYPTLLDLAGLPSRPEQHKDGKSLVPLLKGESTERGPLFWHYPHYSNQGGSPCGATRDGDWKLIENFEDNSLELYNLSTDPSEHNNLAAKETGRAEAMLASLRKWRESVGARMPVPNPDFKPATGKP